MITYDSYLVQLGIELAIGLNSPIRTCRRFLSRFTGILAQVDSPVKNRWSGYIIVFIFGLLLAGVAPSVHAGRAADILKTKGFSQGAQDIADLVHGTPERIQPVQRIAAADGFRELVIGDNGLQYALEFDTEPSPASGLDSPAGLAAVEDGTVSATLSYTITGFGTEPISEQLTIELKPSDDASLFFEPDKGDPELLHILFDSSTIKEPQNIIGVDIATDHLHITTLKKSESMILDIVIDSINIIEPRSYQLVVDTGVEFDLAENFDNSTDSTNLFVYRSQPLFTANLNTPENFNVVDEATAVANFGFPLVSGVYFSDPILAIPINVFSESPLIFLNYVPESDNSGNRDSGFGDDFGLSFGVEFTWSYEEGLSSSTETAQQEESTPPEAFPPSNRDLDSLIRAANALKGLGSICDDYECPQIDCDLAHELVQSLFDAKVYLRLMHYHLRQANDLYLQHWNNLMEQYGITATSQYNTIIALSWQQALHNFGAAMLDVASFYEFVQDFVKDAAKGTFSDDMSPLQLLDKIDDAFEALKDLEDGINNVTSDFNNGKGTGTAINDFEENLTGNFIHTQKSTLSNVKTIIKEAIEHGEDWKAALKAGKATAALGQIAGRYLEIYSKSLIEERTQHYEQLVRDASAEERAIAEAYLQLQRVQTRRFKVEDTQKVVQDVVASIQPCIEDICGDASLNFRAVFEVQDQSFNQPHPLNPNIKNFQPALIFANAKIEEITEALSKSLEVKEGCPVKEEVIFIIEPVDVNRTGEIGKEITRPQIGGDFNENGLWQLMPDKGNTSIGIDTGSIDPKIESNKEEAVGLSPSSIQTRMPELKSETNIAPKVQPAFPLPGRPGSE